MRKTLALVLATVMVLALVVVGVSAAPEGEAIKTAAEFAAMKADGTYYLDADIVVALPYEGDFVGTLDGNGKTVTVSAPMFTSFGGTIKNLTITGEIVAVDSSCGAIANTVSSVYDMSFEKDYAIVEKVTNKANITVTISDTFASTFGVGGFFGTSPDNGGVKFIECKNEGNVTVDNKSTQKYGVGGFTGDVDTVLAIKCVNEGAITAKKNLSTEDKVLGTSYVGGFSGWIATVAGMNFSQFDFCQNDGEITATSHAGGLTGFSGLGSNYAQYDMGNTPYRYFGCVNNGKVTSTGSQAGGIAGYIYANGANEQQTFDIEFCLNTGDITSTQWTGHFVAYSNSVFNKMMYNVSTGSINKAEGSTVDYWGVFMGCSSVHYLDDETFHDNYVLDPDNKLQYFTYATDDKNSANRTPAAEGISGNFFTVVTSAEMSSGEVAFKINEAAKLNGFNQAIGTDLAPSPLATGAVVKDGSSYKNGDAQFDAIEVYEVTDEVITTKDPSITTKEPEKQTTAEQTTVSAPEDDTTAAPKTDDTTAAPKTDDKKPGCGGFVGMGVALVAILGTAYVAKKKF